MIYLRLEVPVHDALPVEVVQGLEKLPHVKGGLRIGQAAARLVLEVPVQVPAARVGHDDEDCITLGYMCIYI